MGIPYKTRWPIWGNQQYYCYVTPLLYGWSTMEMFAISIVVEYWYNSYYQALLGTLTFMLVYGRDPPSLHSWIRWSLFFSRQITTQVARQVLWHVPSDKRIGEVAYRYRWQPSPSAKLHNMFLLGLLKPFKGEPPLSPPQLSLVTYHQWTRYYKTMGRVKARLAHRVKEVLV